MDEEQSIEMIFESDCKMLMKCEEQLLLLEKMLMEPESKKVADKEGKCSSIKIVELEIKCNFQFNYGDASIENVDEYELKFQNSNIRFQMKTRLDIEIKELRKLMEEVHISRCCEMRQTDNNIIHLNAQVYIKKINGILQKEVWKPGKQENATSKHQQHNGVHDQQHTKVWDPGGV